MQSLTHTFVLAACKVLVCVTNEITQLPVCTMQVPDISEDVVKFLLDCCIYIAISFQLGKKL